MKFYQGFLGFTPISIKVAYVKNDATGDALNDAWSMLHSPRCIMGASRVNYLPAKSLETQKANATMLYQQNVTTMNFKSLNPRLFRTAIWV